MSRTEGLTAQTHTKGRTYAEAVSSLHAVRSRKCSSLRYRARRRCLGTEMVLAMPMYFAIDQYLRLYRPKGLMNKHIPPKLGILALIGTAYCDQSSNTSTRVSSREVSCHISDVLVEVVQESDTPGPILARKGLRKVHAACDPGNSSAKAEHDSGDNKHRNVLGSGLKHHTNKADHAAPELTRKWPRC